MPPIASDKELRRLVADLAAATTEDVAAVLDMLDTRTRAQVRALLAAYAGIEDISEPEASPAFVNTSGLSDWLAARTLGKPLSGADSYHITPHAGEALRACVSAMPPQKRSASGTPSKTASTSRRDRLSLLFGQSLGNRGNA